MANHAARTLVIPPRVDSGMETNFYMVLFDRDTGQLVDAATGVLSATTAWADAAFIVTAHWTAQTISLWPVVSIPALPMGKNYGYACFDSASPLVADIPTRSGLYSAETGSLFDDTCPTLFGRVAVIQRKLT